MGRKRKEKDGIFDRIGEEVNLEKCPECSEHPDCFCHLNGKCTALNASGGQGCVFYKPTERALEEGRTAYRKLKAAKRHDLIQRYIKAYTAMGFLDEEIVAADEKIKEFEAFRHADFRKLMTQVPGFS